MYEWDFDYDGVPANFSADAAGPAVTHSYDEVGSFTAALRVTDGDGATDIEAADIAVDSMFYFGGGCAAINVPATGDLWQSLRATLVSLLAFLLVLTPLCSRKKPRRHSAPPTGRVPIEDAVGYGG